MWALSDMRRRTLEDVARLDVARLDHVPPGAQNSIGTLLDHPVEHEAHHRGHLGMLLRGG